MSITCTTLDTYSHVLPGMGELTAAATEALLSKDWEVGSFLRGTDGTSIRDLQVARTELEPQLQPQLLRFPPSGETGSRANISPLCRRY